MYIIIMTVSYIFIFNNFQITSNCVYTLKKFCFSYTGKNNKERTNNKRTKRIIMRGGTNGLWDGQQENKQKEKILKKPM